MKQAFNFKNRWALVTGATAGIGEATSRALASEGCNLVITGRREERLQAMKQEFEKAYGINVETLAFDIRKREEIDRAFAKIEGINISVLVNNAGLALGTDPLQNANDDEIDAMIDTNVRGLLSVTRRVLPKMIANKDGHIVNLGSVAGRWVYRGGAIYCATKFAVRAITEALRMDVLGHPIRVTNIEPGMVETEFSEVRYHGDKEKAAKVYEGMNPLKPQDIAETIVWCLARPLHVNIQELVIYPTDQAAVGPYVHRRS